MKTLMPILKHIFNFIVIFTTILFIYHGLNGLSINGISKSLLHADFYINYEGGFMRRGLDGQGIYLFSKFFSLNPLIVQKTYNGIFFLIFVFYIINLIIKNKIPIYLMLSMSILLLYIYYLSRGIRKDHILIVLFAVNLFVMKKNKKNIWLSFFLQNVILSLGILLHEIFFIVSIFPIILINNLNYNIRFSLKKGLKLLLYLLPAFIIFIIVSIFFPGNVSQKIEILNSWQNIGVAKDTFFFNPGIFEDPQYIWKFSTTFNQYVLFFIILFIHFCFVGIIIINCLAKKELKFIFLILLTLQYGTAIFLSIVATDYSRWIFFANITSVITIFFIKNNINIPFKFSFGNSFYSFLLKIGFITYILYFFVNMTHGGWHGLDDYIKCHPINLVYGIFYNGYLFRIM